MKAERDADASAPQGGRAWPWFALALAAFLLRAIAAHQYQSAHPHAELLAIDEAAYDAWARRIAGGEWVGEGVFFQEPLYSYVLGAVYAVFGAERFLVRLAQALLGALVCVAVGKLAERWFGRNAGLVAGGLLAVHAPLVLAPCFLLKEALLLPALALLFVLLGRTRDERGGGAGAWLALGVLGGAGALLRGNVLVLLPLLVLAPIARATFTAGARNWNSAVRRSVACACGALVVLGPVLARNRAVGSEFVLTTSQAGTNLYAGNNAENPFGRAYEVSFVRGVPEHEAEDWRRESERRTGRAMLAGEVSAFWRAETFRSVGERPALHARILWNKLRLTLGAHEVADNHAFEWDVRYVPLLAGPWPGFGVLGTLGLAGLAWHALRRARGKRPATGADELALAFLLYLGTIVLTVTSDRARLPLVLMLAPFAAAFALELAAAVRAAAFRRVASLFALAVLAGAFVLLSLLPARERAEDLDERDFNLAGLWSVDAARRADARSLAARLVQRHPGSARARLLASGIELEDARTLLREPNAGARAVAAERIAALVGALRASSAEPELGPRERHRADVLLGEAELLSRNTAGARAAFERALVFDPDAPGTRLGLARAELLAAAEAASPDERSAGLRRAQELLLELRDPRLRLERELAAAVELAWAHAEFARGEPGLAAQAPDAHAAVQSALRVLQPLARDERLARATRAAARRMAGRIQLAIGTDAALESAENHFRAARELDSEPESMLGLAQVLVARAERADDGRAARVDEARGIERELAALDGENAALRELAQRIERLAGATAPR